MKHASTPVTRATKRPAHGLLPGLLALVSSPALPAPAAAVGPVGLQPDAVFTDYCPLASNSELVRRLLSPLAADEVQRMLARSKQQLTAQSIDLSAEKFTLYVPPRAPPHGYALLVFISPWDDAQLPQGWGPVLQENGVIFVSAAHSGNEADVLGRREPLALLAACNLMQRYPVDAQRVYVGGFSGGSRIALRLALGYPDLFRGALLNAGSDPLGAGPPTLPPRELLLRFQEATRIIYVTGEQDTLHLSMDADSLHSMRKWCVFDVASRVTFSAGHELANTSALSWALPALATHLTPDPGKLAACRADIDRELAAQLARVQSLVDAGQHAQALKLLHEVDRRFGGLAAPRSLALQAELD